MTPQSNVMVVAPVNREREAELRSLLDSMNEVKGKVNPANALIPFQQFEQIHFARFIILDDQSVDDIHTAYGLPRVDWPLSLAFLADFDGSANEFRADLARRAGEGLRRIFSCCQDFSAGEDLVRWMKDHETPPATMYQNWRGRTVRQVLEENGLRLALEAHVQANAKEFAAKTLQEVYAALKTFVGQQLSKGQLMLTPPASTPFRWLLGDLVHLIGVPLIVLLLSPLLLLYLPIFIYQLRKREKSDMEIAPGPTLDYEQTLASLEDYDVTNQFSAMGSLKPGLFRIWTVTFVLWVLDWTTRHIFIRGHLSRVPTIHFARWVFINQKRRLVFASNYDGSLASYMDDFINKVGWGLNLVFSNGIGYPTTNWLVLDGSKDEQKFKYFLRRHELPTEVWYKAYPGLTAFDLKRNTLIRKGIEKSTLSGAELRQWVALL